jgi:hypothetical protein
MTKIMAVPAKMLGELGAPKMYTRILINTDASDVARKGVEHGLA